MLIIVVQPKKKTQSIMIFFSPKNKQEVSSQELHHDEAEIKEVFDILESENLHLGF